MRENSELVDAVIRLTAELRTVRDVLDELRQEIQWIARNQPQLDTSDTPVQKEVADRAVASSSPAIATKPVEQAKGDSTQRELF